MLLILLSWVYITFTCINAGLLLNRFFKLREQHFSITAIFGLFIYTLVGCTWAVFSRINVEFHSFLLLFNLLLFSLFRKEIIATYSNLIIDFKSLTISIKFFLITSTLLIVAQCSTAPYVIDNESYYIQTIKALNDYGLIKGLGNIHFFLAQTSAWHITQSVFSFSFLYTRFNDLSGYCLLLGNLYAIGKLDQYFKSGGFNNIVIGLLPVTNLFFFQFISAPSPDIPVYILSFITISLFLDSKKENCTENFVIIIILVIYLTFIKTTSIVMLSIPLYMLVVSWRQIVHKIIGLSLIVFTTMSLFLVKNTIISGYPLFPITSISYDCDWKMPEVIAKLYYSETKLCGFLVKQNKFDSMTNLQLFVRWLTLPKLHGIFNKIQVMLVIVSPCLIYFYKVEKKWWFLYAVMVIQLLVLYTSSPQYRFLMNFILLFTFFIAGLSIKKIKFIKITSLLSLLMVIFVLFVPLNLNKFSKNKFMMSTSNFSLNYLIHPHSNSKFPYKFELINENGFKYYSTVDNTFLLGSGDGPVPTVNKGLIKYFKSNYNTIPQMRGNSAKDGYFSKKIENNY